MILIRDGIMVIDSLNLAGEISDLHTAAFGFRRCPSMTEYKIKQRIKDPNYESYGYIENGMLVGFFYVWCECIFTSKWIVSFCVAPWKRGKGIGSQMLQFILDKYKRYDFHLTVMPGNDMARGLYKKFEFVNTNETMMKRSNKCSL